MAKIQEYLTLVDEGKWRGTTKHSSGEIRPNALALACPSCGHFSVFGIGSLNLHRPSLTAHWQSTCANCSELSRFTAYFPEETSSQNKRKPIAIVQFCNQRTAIPVPTYASDVPKRLFQSLESAIQSLNQHNYPAAANGARRTLEALFFFLDGQKTDLPRAIENMAKKPTIADPLLNLATAVKNGGNLGSHFDEEKEPDYETAKQLILLLEYLVEYFFELPQRVEHLESVLDD